jgi:DNA-3-methyladenine glycosylase II
MAKTKSPWHEAEAHLAAADPAQRNLIAKYGPCRLAPKTDYFGVLCNSVISQQLAVKAADAIHSRFITYFGGTPSEAAVLAAPPEELRALGLSGKKVEYITDLAAKIAAGDITPGRFPVMSDDEIITQLVSVKGVGVWTAHMFLIFALNRPDVLPFGDFGVRKAMMLVYGLEAMPDKATMEKVAARWCPWRSIASWYLWRSLENKNN